MNVGQSFSSKQDLKNALVLLNAASGCNISTSKSDKLVYTVVCAEKDTQSCKWRLHAKCHDNNWIVKTHYNEHVCIPTRQSRSSFGFKEIIPIFQLKMKDSPSYSSGEMVKDLKRDHNLDIDYHVCHRAKEMILNSINGELRENYTLLKKFLTVFEKKNQGSFVRVEDNDGVFLRAFVAPAACVGAFKFLRPLVSVDGTHMRALTKGILLCAAGIDSLGQVVPLCYALVDVECFESWDWFLCCFKQAFAIDDDVTRKITLLSDRQKGLINAVAARFPVSAHRMCVYHRENLKKRINKKTLSDKVIQLAKAKTPLQYEELLVEIGDVSEIAREDLAGVEKSQFVDAFFPGRRFGQYTSNISGSLDSTILAEREEFPFQAFQGLIRKYAEVFQQRKDKYADWSSTLPPKLTKKIQSMMSYARTSLQVHHTSSMSFELVSPDVINVVNLGEKSCTCCQFQDRLFPSVHAVIPIQSLTLPMVDFVSPYYYTESLQSTYSLGTTMVSSEELQAVQLMDIAMPPFKRRPGRTSKHGKTAYEGHGRNASTSLR